MGMIEKHIPTALYIAPDGSGEEIVQPAGTFLQPGNRYYLEYPHKGHLYCTDKDNCSVKMRFQEGSATTDGGDGPARQDHFRPIGKHSATCTVARRDQTKTQDIDHEKGYLLKVNTIAAFEPSPEKRPDLKGREVRRVKRIKDFEKFLREGDLSRFRDTQVKAAGAVYPLRDVFATAAKPQSYARLHAVARARGEAEVPPLCFVELDVDSEVLSRWHPSRKLDINPVLVSGNGLVKRYVQVHLWVQDLKESRENWGIFVTGDMERHRYLAMGFARAGKRWKSESGRTIYDRVNLTITSPDQVMFSNIENIRARHEERRGKQSDQAASPLILRA